MKKSKPKLTEIVKVRVSTQEKNRLRWLADHYAGGNLSLWLVYAGLSAERKYLKENDLRDSGRRIDQGKK